MRNEDLKNKLDQRPIDFDREALWERIESQPEEKKRGLVWWWIGVAFLVILGLFCTRYYNNKTKSIALDKAITEVASDINNDDENEIYKANVDKDTPSEEVKDMTWAESESISSNDIDNGIEIKSIEKNVGKPTPSEAVSSDFSRQVKDSNNAIFNVGSIGPIYNESATSSLISHESQMDNFSRDQTQPEINSIQELNLSESITFSTDPIEFVFAAKLTFSRSKIENGATPISSIKSTGVNWLSNTLAINMGIGSDMHQFDDDEKYRRSELESNLESLVAHLSYHKYITKNWVLSMGLGYARSQTKIELTSLDSDQYVRSIQDGNTYITTTETSRKLFNQYSRWDADLSLGYEMRLGKWSFIPSVGRSINLNSTAKGDVINLDDEAIGLNDLSIYKDRTNSYWISRLNVNRSINDQIRVGLVGRVESSRSLTHSDHNHSITPVSIRFRLEWLW